MSTASKQVVDLRDEKTFEFIFKSHYEQLVTFAFRYVKDDDTAEELVQDLFSNLWIKADQILIRTSLTSYLLGAVRNACLNYLKHEKVKNSYASYQLQTQPDMSQSDHLELDELQSEIDHAMAKIPEKCREIFEMSRYDGKKYQEIADELNLSIKTVENQMGKALKILRSELKDYLILLIWLIAHGGKF